ncbi:MAG: c-type cytochrome [Planctomycetaceae bacterium]|nr:c-type cytochrome [Planctomycetaceae bacterium]
MLRCVAALAVVVVTLVSPSRVSFGQFDEDGDLIPGLLGTYVAGDNSVEQIDVTLSHSWGEAAPDERLPEGPFSVTWQSQLLQREEVEYRFHAYLQGEVEVQVDGETVLIGSSDEPGWISGDPIELSFGLLEFEVTFEKTQPSAEVHLFWSSDAFPLEPIPPHLLFRDQGRPDLATWERGRELYAAHRCNRCHRRDDEPLSPAAPSLEHVAIGVDHTWLVDKLLNRLPSAAHARMPSFGFSEEEAQAVVAYLESHTVPVELSPISDIDAGKKGPPDGDLLLKSVGCLACHTVGDVGQQNTFSGGDLTHIGDKRSAEWLYRWLSDPSSLNVDHRMPVVKLTDLERAEIAKTLASWKRETNGAKTSDTSSEPDESLVTRGRQLVEQSRCTACHRLPGNDPGVTSVPPLKLRQFNWDQSCLSGAKRELGRPVYENVDVQALQAYVESRLDALSPPSQWAKGRAVLERRNCLACHERDLGTGIVPIAGTLERTDERFRGQSQSLIPPSLTAVGDKLLDKALAVAVRGEQKSPRLPWLQVRMPRFSHTEEDQRLLLSYLVEHDRIPAGAPESLPGSEIAGDQTTDAQQTLLTGHALAGAGAFNCVACHKFGDYEPRNVALGTKGCDLLMIGDRMRSEFFHRWTRAPLRVVPGMEMPNFNKPVAGVLDSDVDRQISAVWRAINDPRFTAPTNPTQVEQLLIVEPDMPPQIIRDVFTVSPQNGGGYVARSFAIGFGNGHSLLFDIDRFAVRGWTLGDFARQRTEGKSWYWDLAGVDVMTGFNADNDLVLLNNETEEETPPILNGARVAKLLRYQQDGERVTLQQTMSFTIDDNSQDVSITQEFSTFSDDDGTGSGVLRRVTASPIPEGYDLVLRSSAETPQLAGAAITTKDARRNGQELVLEQVFVCSAQRPLTPPKPRPELPRNDALVTTLPGMTGQRLKLPASIMPTSIALTDDDRLVFTSLKGHVYEAVETDGDGLRDSLRTLEQGLPAPFGVLPHDGGILVVDKAELLWLSLTEGDQSAVEREIWADGWGFSDNYHDWVTGPVRDAAGNLYLALGSDYQQPERSEETSRWRGKVLRIDHDRRIEPFAHELRFPQGIAIDGQDRLFVSDQQGVANTFNEINYIVQGRHYGVKSLHEEVSDATETRAAVQVPHPWTRSVNGIFFLPQSIAGPLAPFGGHGIGCEYNGKRLIRFSVQEVNGELQGACYDFSRPTWENEELTFLGPICGLATSDGTLYVGSIFDSGWLGGPNTGEIVKLTPDESAIPNCIRELRATATGLEIEFLQPVDATRALDPENYVLSGYTRVWQGAYATPDSGRYTPEVTDIELAPDGRTVTLTIPDRRLQYVYEVNCGHLVDEGHDFFPATGYYTMNQIPSTKTE